MIDRLRTLATLVRPAAEPEPPGPAPLFTALRLFSAKLLVSGGLNATLQFRRVDRGGPGGARGPVVLPPGSDVAPPGPATWIPLVLGSAAGVAQTASVLLPDDERRRSATRLLGGAVVGVGIAGAAHGAAGFLRGEGSLADAFAPLLFGYTGALTFLLDREERAAAEGRAELERRARLVERLVPRRRTRIERIVVRV